MKKVYDMTTFKIQFMRTQLLTTIFVLLSVALPGLAQKRTFADAQKVAADFFQSKDNNAKVCALRVNSKCGRKLLKRAASAAQEATDASLEEEQILRSFFSQICVPEELAKYRPLFNYEQTETKTDRLGDDFDERIMSMIDEPQEIKVKAQPIHISQRFAPLFKAAAMVAIVLTLTQAAQFSFQKLVYIFIVHIIRYY